ncbi:MAG: radical SAM protein [Candidatus Omnitrophota bacterium]
MRIGLISPYPSIFSFGIRVLSSCLKKEGHSVKTIFIPSDFWSKYDNDTLENVTDLLKDVALIGISLTTNFFDNCVQITQKLKRDLNIPIAWGGIHPTLRPQECLDYADMVCIGEAEETLIELARRIERKEDYRNVRGVWLKDKGKIISNELRPLIQDLDSIPFQDYDCENHYILENKRCVRMSKELLEKHMKGSYLTLPTRGCPFGCSYCNNNAINKIYANQKIIRQRSIRNIIQELMQVKDGLSNVKCIYFDDDAFLLYAIEEIKEFCSEYKRNIKLPLVITGATPITLTREKLSFLVDAGLFYVRMGIETGSENTRKMYKRSYSNEQVINAARIINEFKDKIASPQYDIILDNPWENDDDIIKTLMLLTKLPPPYHLAIFSLTFYPQTELYEKAKKEGIIKNDLEDVYRKYFHSCRKTYLNKLFFLLNAQEGRISTITMSLLTNRILRKLKLNWLLYWMAVLRYQPARYKNILSSSFQAVRKGNFSRISGYVRKRIADLYLR